MAGDDWASLKASKTDWLREQKIRILMQLTSGSHPDLPDVPLADDFATSEINRRVLALFVERQSNTAVRCWRHPARGPRSWPLIGRLSVR
jgi:hypothetical protein